MPCPECGTHGEAPDPEASRWQCSSCGNGFFLRRCSACARISYVDGLQGFHSPWPCMWCGQFNRGFNQNMDPAAASVAELAAELARFGADRPGAERAEAETGDGDSAEPVFAAYAGAEADADAGSVPMADLESPPWSTRGQHRLAVIVALAALGVAAGVLAVAEGHAATSESAGLASHSSGTQAVQSVQSGTRPVQVTASEVGTADVQGVPGQLTIVSADTGQVKLTGELNWTRQAPGVHTRLDRATGVLDISIRCAPATRCTENLRLEVPSGTATIVRQPAGRVMVTGLAGPLRITAGNVDIIANGLRSPELTARITSGQLSATFAAPPRQVSVTLASAQATLRLPSTVGYRITQKVASGHIGIAVPQTSSATRTVTACLHSSELELLPS